MPFSKPTSPKSISPPNRWAKARQKNEALMSQRRKRSSSKANLILSFLFHSLIVLGVFYFAARQGVMGDKMKSLVATLEQQKPKEQPKPPKEEPKIEAPKQVEPPKALAAA